MCSRSNPDVKTKRSELCVLTESGELLVMVAIVAYYLEYIIYFNIRHEKTSTGTCGCWGCSCYPSLVSF